MKYHQLTTEELDKRNKKIIQLRDQGYSPSDVARRFGVNRQCVSKVYTKAKAERDSPK